MKILAEIKKELGFKQSCSDQLIITFLFNQYKNQEERLNNITNQLHNCERLLREATRGEEIILEAEICSVCKGQKTFAGGYDQYICKYCPTDVCEKENCNRIRHNCSNCNGTGIIHKYPKSS